METIVVTLSADRYAQDYELPCNVPLRELYPRMEKVLRQETTGMVPDGASICFDYHGTKLTNPQATLMDYGVCSGSILTVWIQKVW